MKQVAQVGGGTMLERVVAVARAAGLAPIVTVVPAGLGAPTGALRVVNDRPEDGLSRSLRLGVGALPPDVGAAVILLGDQPTVDPSTIEALIDHGRGARPVVAPRAAGRIGPPVLIRREAFHLVEEARGDDGLAPVLARYPELVTHMDIAVHSPDIDTPSDLANLQDALSREVRGS